MKVNFFNDDRFEIFCVYDDDLVDEASVKSFFKLLSKRLISRYDYEFSGYYDVTIYRNSKVIVLIFDREDDYGRADFNITLLLNSMLLYEFEDEDIFSDNKIYYKRKYYCEANEVEDRIDFFEFGDIVYGNYVDEVLSKGVMIS